MKIWACAGLGTVIKGAQTPGWMKMIRESHIEGILTPTFNVTGRTSLENIAKVKKILDEEGFAVMAIGLPLGHPEGLDTPCYTFHEGWHIRRDMVILADGSGPLCQSFSYHIPAVHIRHKTPSLLPQKKLHVSPD